MRLIRVAQESIASADLPYLSAAQIMEIAMENCAAIERSQGLIVADSQFVFPDSERQ